MVHFQSSEKVVSDNLAGVFIDFMEEGIFRSPYIFIFSDVTPLFLGGTYNKCFV